MANKLYPLSSISQQIEDFAKKMLFSVTSDDVFEFTDAEGSIADSQKVLTHLWIYFFFVSPLDGKLMSFVELDMIVCFFPFRFQGPDAEKVSNEQSSLSGSTKAVSDNRQSCTSESVSPDSVSEAQRCMSLYFALCTKVLFIFLSIHPFVHYVLLFD